MSMPLPIRSSAPKPPTRSSRPKTNTSSSKSSISKSSSKEPERSSSSAGTKKSDSTKATARSQSSTLVKKHARSQDLGKSPRQELRSLPAEIPKVSEAGEVSPQWRAQQYEPSREVNLKMEHILKSKGYKLNPDNTFTQEEADRLPPPVTQAILEVVPDFFTEAKTKPSSSEVADEEERFNHPDHSAQNINSFAQELRNEFSQTYTATPDNINQFKQNLESIASKEELEHLGLDMATDTITEAEYSDFKDPLKALVHRHFPGLSDNWEDSPRWTTIHDRYWNEETQEYERPPTLGYKRQLAMAQGAIGPENRLERYNRAAHQAEVMLKPVNVWGNGSPNAGVNMMGSASEMGNAERARKEGFSTLISELAMAPIGFGLGRLVPIALRPAFEMTGRGLVGMRYGLKGENKDFGVNGPGLQEGLRSAALIEPPKEKVKAKPPTNESPVLPIETPTAKRPSNIDPPTMPASPPEDDASGQAPITALPVSPVVPNLVLPNTRPPLGQENKPIADKVKQELDLPTSIPISELLPPESETPEPSNRWSWENWGWGNWSWDKELSRAKKFCQNLVPSWAWWR